MRFWQTIRRLRGKNSGEVGGIKPKDGTLLSNENDIICRWKEYFSEILNPVEGAESDIFEAAFEAEKCPSVEEIVAAIKSLKNGKSAEVDEIRPDILKVLGEVQWLSRVVKMV